MFTSFDDELNHYLSTCHNHPIMMSERTPACLVDAGCPDLPMYIGCRHVDSILADFEDLESQHGIPQSILSRIPEELEKPVFVIDSPARPDSVVVCVDLYDTLNQPIFVTIHINGFVMFKNRKVSCNFVTSVYGKRPDGVVGTFGRACANDDVVYVDKRKFCIMKSKIAMSFAMKRLNSIIDQHPYDSANARNAIIDKDYYNSFYEEIKFRDYRTRYSQN